MFKPTPGQTLRAIGQARAQAELDDTREAQMPSPRAGGWLGIHEGRVAASDRSLGRLIARLKKNGVAVEEATFRFIDRRQHGAPGVAGAGGYRT